MIGSHSLGIIASQSAGATPTVPSDVSGLIRWYRADDLALSDEDEVASWPDLSPIGADASQATASRRPRFDEGVANGHDAVRWDGSDDLLTHPMLLNSSGAAAHIFVVAKSNSTGTRSILTTRKDTPSVVGWSIRYNSPTEVAYLHPGASAPSTVTVSVADQINIIEVQRSGLDITIGANGSLESPVTFGGYNVNSDDTLAGIGARVSTSGAVMDGPIAEIIIYDRVLSSQDRGGILAYLTGRYS